MRKLTVVLAGVLTGGVLLGSPAGVWAANQPAFRDCSFAAGLDPDFVQLSGAMAGSDGKLTVPATGQSVQITASESADPGDNSGHDTLSVTVSAPGAAARMLSGSGVGKVVLQVPLNGARPGQSYTISWAATFDNGNHTCPSSSTPENAQPEPFVIEAPPGAPASPAKKRCHKRVKRVHGHRRTVKVCTKQK